MDTHFYIQLTLQTDQGPEPYGRLDLGSDRNFALSIWNRMQGDADLTNKPLLQIEWIEADMTLPLEIKVKGCTLPQLASNCTLITKEVFRVRNLQGNKNSDL